MSALQPIVELPTPNYAAEQAAKPYDPDAPVKALSASVPSSAAEAGENSAGARTGRDAYELSSSARTMARAERAESDAERDAEMFEAKRLRDNLAIRELILSFRNYDNSAAARDYDLYLNMFVRYGVLNAAVEEDTAIASMRAAEDELYGAMGFSAAAPATREDRERVAGAIDRWFAGRGVFSPEMLRYRSSDGFRFTPVSDAARAAERATDVLASYDRARIAAYLREMASLTPADFMFHDPTGLADLDLERRREFLGQLDAWFAREGIDVPASELHYVFNENGELQADALGLDDRYRTRLDELLDEINTYYGQLRAMVHQYKAGIVSSALA